MRLFFGLGLAALLAPLSADAFRKCVASDLVDVHMCNLKKIVPTRAKLCQGGALSATAAKDEDKCPAQCESATSNPDANIGYMETECDRATSTMTRRFFHKDPTCVTGMLPLPVEGIPCHEVCGKGEYIDAHTRKCTKCEPGTYSRSGGDAYESWNATAKFPWQFRRECVQASIDKSKGDYIDCPGWVAAGSYVHSGRNYPAANPDDETTYSALRLPVSLVRPGSVMFRFRVDSASDDGLMFLVDGRNMMEFARGGANTSRVFREFTAPLTEGFHELKWVYAKNAFGTKGYDRAEIEAIEVIGTRWTGTEKEECVPCAAGSFNAKAGATSCDLCPPGKSATGPGNKACKTCDKNHEYAFEGSAICHKREPCTVNDYERVVEKCKKNTRKVSYKWRKPVLCDQNPQTGAVTLPPPESAKCAPCAPGTEPAGSGSFECVACKDGFASPGRGAPCTQCSAGQAAVRSLVLDSFENPGTYLKSNECEGSCGTGGWVLTSDHAISSGKGHYSGVTVTIEFELDFYTEGSVSFDWALQCRDSCELSMLVDYMTVFSTANLNSDELDAPGPGRNNTRTAGPFPMDVGYHTIVWRYRSDAMSDGRTLDHAIITRINAEGVRFAGVGAPVCTSCGPGTAVKTVLGESADRCRRCQPGTFSSGSANAECTECGVDTHATHSEAITCVPCGPGTGTDGQVGAVNCETNCTYLGRDLSGLAATGAMFGPVHDDDAWVAAQGSTSGVEDADSEAWKSERPEYFVSVCKPPSPGNDSCIDDGFELGALGCRISHDAYRDYGLVMPIGETAEFAAYPGAAASGLPPLSGNLSDPTVGALDKGDGIVLRYEAFNEMCDGHHTELNITFLCDPAAGEGRPRAWPGRPVQDPPCRFNMLWRSIYGCRACTAGDWIALTAVDCIDGVARVEHVLREGIVCYGGAPMPAAGGAVCANHMHVHVYFATIVVLLLIILAAGIVHVVLQNRRMYAAYSRLTANEAEDGSEMGGMGGMMQSSFTVGEPLEDSDDAGGGGGGINQA